VLGKKLGHSRQAVELTDYGPASELSFHSYRAVLSVTPTERTGAEASTAALLEGLRGAHSLEVELPRGYPDGAGLVLQSVTIDTSPRAAGGICLSGMDLGVDWAEHPLDDAQVATITDASGRRSISLRASLLGGLCNDFNVQLPEEYHGLTTDPEAGVRVTIGFAVVQGGEARHATVTAAQRDRPGVRAKGSDPASIAQGSSPPPPPAYAHATAPYRIDNDGSKDNLGCVQIGPGEDEAELLPKPSTRLGPTDAESAWMVESDGSIPEQGRSGQATSLRGFTLATDLRGFDPSLASDAYRDVTELTARSQNNYIYRYLLRTWLQPDGSVFLEGGLAHGIHTSGPGKDNALPSAVLVSADLAWWEGLSAPPIAYGAAPPQRARDDANLQPEDGFLRWAFTQPRDQEEVTCYSR
jgi:hypothetical protein